MFEDILATGITDLCNYPKLKCTEYCKQCVETDMLSIPREKPDVESINEVKVNICVERVELINTILGPKLVLHCVKNIKVIYTANNCQQSVHSSHWSIPFCEFILLKNLCYENCFSMINDIFVGVEKICVNNCNPRYVDVSVIFIICPIIKDRNVCCCEKQCDSTREQYSPCSHYFKYS